MRTVNRTPKEINTDVNNYSKYKNQLNFKGIVLDSNIFAVDQDSFTDTNNIYVDEDMSLISREPITIEDIPAGTMPDNSRLVDIQYTKDIIVYISQNNNDSKYTISAYKENSGVKTLSNVGQYHLSTYNQYIICFKDTGAQILNINDFNTGWQDLKDFSEVPVTKKVSGPSIKEEPSNKFTDAHKDVYIRKNDIQTILPDDSTASVDGKIISSYGTNTFKFNFGDRHWKLPEYRIIKPLNVELTSTVYNISANKNILAITLENNILLSYTGGASFTTIEFPTSQAGLAGGAHCISEDGKCYFYITEVGVYRLTLDDLNWTLIRVKNGLTNETLIDPTTGYIYDRPVYCYFKNAEVFTFYYRQRIYFKAPGMWTGDAKYDNMLCYLDTTAPLAKNLGDNLRTYNIKITVGDDGNGAAVCAVHTSDNKIYIVTVIGLGTQTASTIYVQQFDKIMNSPYILTINDVSKLSTFSTGHSGNGVQIFGVYTGSDVKTYSCEAGYDTSTSLNYINIVDIKTISLNSDATLIGIPLLLNGNVYITYSSVWDTQSILDAGGNLGSNTFNFPKVNNIEIHRGKFTIAGDKFYILYNGIIYTNNFADNDVIEVIYTYSGSTNYFKDVPKVSYSGSELYLGFDNLLRITNNTRDGDKTLFSLLEIYDQPFADNITGLINISTTQLAIFFDKAITICSKVENETSGYIYEYQKTRLSLGTRLGDDIINTLDGAATVFANARGLAIMNYQAYMATSDQVLTFISDKIVELWKEFYAKSTNIKIVQMRNYIYISNGTEEYLMIDTRTYTWWKFTVPTKVSKLVTDQIDLYLLSNMLYLFNLNYNKDKYYDEVYDASGNMTQIPWRLESQRLHFNLPNHYKNIKQLIFQLKQTNKYQNTIRAQIKIFRKVIDYGDPQIVAFNIDEYRTFVKRFNYWKINELQWILANDTETAIPSQLKLNGIDIKYEVGEEVR